MIVVVAPRPDENAMPVLGVLERGEALLERRPRRVRDARVVVALVDADRLLHEGRGLVDRRDDRAGRRVGLLPVVDRARLEVHAGDGSPAQPERVTRAPRANPRAASASSSRDVSPQAPSSSSVARLRGRSAARRGRRARRRRGAAGRSSRTRASPSGRTSRAGSGSPRAPRRGRGRGRAGRRARGDVTRSGHRRRRSRRGAPPSRSRDEPHARRAEAPLREDPLGRRGSETRLRLRAAALGEIPEPLPAARPATATSPRRWSEREHQPDLARPYQRCRSRSRRGAVLELAREERPASLELAQHVAAEGAVLGEELAHPALRLVVASSVRQRRMRGRGRAAGPRSAR